MSEEKLMMLLEKLGAEGISAFYVYLALDYVSIWLLIGLITWGVRTVWKQVKVDFK